MRSASEVHTGSALSPQRRLAFTPLFFCSHWTEQLQKLKRCDVTHHDAGICVFLFKMFPLYLLIYTCIGLMFIIIWMLLQCDRDPVPSCIVESDNVCSSELHNYIIAISKYTQMGCTVHLLLQSYSVPFWLTCYSFIHLPFCCFASRPTATML